MTARHLADYLEATAARVPARTAVVEPNGRSVNYAELNRQADAVAGFLVAHGVKRGDRVGVVLPKSIPAVVTLFGIMKAGAAYVPVDYTAPAERGRKILTDCQIRALVVDARCLAVTPQRRDLSSALAAVIVVDLSGQSPQIEDPGLTPFDWAIEAEPLSGPSERSLADLAYILYTSGSTGIPKGVMLSHENALSFVDWCSSAFHPTEDDRFSSHAPFHFDLSVLDLYLAIKHGASIHLIPDDLGKSPKDLAAFIASRRLTIWYSTPSILTLLLQFGNLQAYDASSLRIVFFAGEVFPVKHLRHLKASWPQPVYFNLYGPTETNVCTFARIPATVPDDRDVPYPIGFACDHCTSLVLDAEGQEVEPGEEGLLHISGPSVFQGYWNRPVENAAAFVDRDGIRWYEHGDLVRWDNADGFLYAGRRDRMVKRRGYRIELGEIERALYMHPQSREVAVIAVPDADAGVKIVAFFVSQGPDAPSIVDLKTFCSTKVPAYMSPDRFVFHERLPKTSTDKIDYQALKGQLQAAVGG